MHLSYRLFPIAALAFVVVVGCAGVEPFRKVACFEAARVSLKSAVAAAERQGGQAIDAGYRQDRELGCLQRDPGVYDVTLLAGEKIKTVSVDARSGQVGPRKSDTDVPDLGKRAIEELFIGGHQGDPSIAQELSLTISQAADVAEREGGKAMAAWAHTNEGKPGYTVELVENGKTRTMWVNGELGIAGS